MSENLSPNKLNCLSHWFPLLEAAGVPVPKTKIVKTEVQLELLVDGTIPDGYGEFLIEVGRRASSIGFPCFLRTGQTSNKHSWKETCYLASLDSLGQHVFNLVEFSLMCDMMGLPFDVWAIREILPTKPVLTAPMYKDMPISREFRFFVMDGKIVCYHPYWPREALMQGFPYKRSDEPGNLLDDDESERDLPPNFDLDYEALCHLGSAWAEVYAMAETAGKALAASAPAWSIDILETTKGYYVTDCALAGMSFHWPGCDRAKEFKREQFA